MNNEICETYHFIPAEYDSQGMSNDMGMSFREWVKECERDYHVRHSTIYALNLYANGNTMHLLQASCGASPQLIYGMDLYHGHSFDPEEDPKINNKIDVHSRLITVYGIDSAFMQPNEMGVPVIDEEEGIWPLTLLIDSCMPNGEIRLSCPDDDDDNEEVDWVPVNPKYEMVL